MREYLNSLLEIDEEIEIKKKEQYSDDEENIKAEYDEYIFHKEKSESIKEAERRNHIVAVFLTVLFGIVGIHKFYIGKMGKGLLKTAIFGLSLTFIFLGKNSYYLYNDTTIIAIGVATAIAALIWWWYDIYTVCYNRVFDINDRRLKGQSHRNNILLSYFTIIFGVLGIHSIYVNKGKQGAFKVIMLITAVILYSWGKYLKESNFMGESSTGEVIFIIAIVLFSFIVLWWMLDIYFVLNEEYISNKFAIVEDETRSQAVAILFAVFGGMFGLDRFYLGYRTLGILKLFTLGGFGISYILDVILIYLNVLKDADGKEMELE
jgi:TM2 domain-containing membrane protein YozV